jgi:tetratricopeptide (TPR) repeat protein
MAIASGRLLVTLALAPSLLGAAQERPGYTEETVPSEGAKRDYELCAEEGQPAEQALQRCEAALRHGLSGRVAGRVHILIGWANWTLGRPGPAAEAWLTAATFEPRDPSLRLGAGLFLEAAGRTAEADVAFREAARAGLRADSQDLLNLVVGYGRGQLLWENYGHVLDRLARGLESARLAAEAREAAAAACDAYQKAPGQDAEALACLRRLILHGEGEARGHLDLALWLAEQPRYGNEEAIVSFHEALRLDPALASAHLGLARALEKQGDAAAALGSYREALRLDPSLSEARQAVAGLEALGLGRSAKAAPAGRPDTPGALAELRRCIDELRIPACRRALDIGLSPQSAARAWTFLALALESAEDEGGTLTPEDAYEKALGVDGGYALAHYRLGLRRQYSRPRDAATSFEAALRLRPDWDAAREALARVFDSERQWDKAAEAYAEILRRRPEDARTARALAEVYSRTERWAEAVPLLEGVCRSPLANTRTWVGLGQALERSGQPAEARSAFLQALDAPDEKDSADNQRIVRSWAVSGLDRTGTAEDGIAARRRWLAADPGLQPAAITKTLLERGDWSQPRWHRSISAQLATALDALGRREQAEAAREAMLAPYREAVAAGGGRPDLHESLADSLAEVGRLDEAAAQSREAVRGAPGEAVWHRSLTRRLERAGRHEDALAAVGRWRALEPASGEAAAANASLLLDLKRDDEALALLREAGAAAKPDPMLWRTLIHALESHGRTEEALAWWRRWFESGPGGLGGWYGIPGPTPETKAAATDAYRRAASSAPHDPLPECALAVTLADPEEALAAARRCAARGPRVAWAQACLGFQLHGRGQHREAVERFEAAEALAPGFLKDRYAEKGALDDARRKLAEEASRP